MIIFSFGFYLFFFLQILLVSRLTFLRLSPLLWLGFRKRCNYPASIDIIILALYETMISAINRKNLNTL